MINLRPYQLDAIDRLKTGRILCGGVGSGKSLTSLGYYYLQNGGSRLYLTGGKYVKMRHPKDLYIITTARKRDTFEWDEELAKINVTTKDEIKIYDHLVVIDSWNNIPKYEDAVDSFFIFDEQRVVGYGAWAKAFIKIAKRNDWILLSATPGDTWSDYMTVFIANGFYKNKSDFVRQHVIYSPRVKFPKIDRYLNVGKLAKHRQDILIDMDFDRPTIRHNLTIWTNYDIPKYRDLMKKRWNPWTDEPIMSPSEYCMCLQKIVNTDSSKIDALLDVFESHSKIIVFYKYDYELEILRAIDFGKGVGVSEWNGHKHEPIQTGCSKWVYFVQYTAGCEGWNCTETDTIVFFSQTYSYKVLEQATGRIDRMNTPFKDLYYYHFKSKSSIDLAISRALKTKKDFNAGKFAQPR